MTRWAQNTCGAFTLVELMAVVVLLALVSALGAVGLSNTGGRARLDTAAATLLYADRSARLLAQRHGSLELGLSRDGATLSITTAFDAARIRVYELPRGTRVELLGAHSAEPVQAIVLDARGRGDDYLARILLGERAESWSVAGLTGWVTRSEGGPP